MFNLLLKNAQVVDPLNGVNDICDVAVENGVIAAVGPDSQDWCCNQASSTAMFTSARCGARRLVRKCSR